MKPFYGKNYNGGDVLIIYNNDDDTGDLNIYITHQIWLSYYNNGMKHLWKQMWGDGLRGDVVVVCRRKLD